MQPSDEVAPRAPRRIGIASLLVGAVLALGGCVTHGPPGVPEPELPLLIHNNAYNDVAVYAVPSAGSSQVRIGTAIGLGDTRLSLRRNMLRAEGSLVLLLHGIGTNRNWVSPSLSVQQGTIACLDIYADASGDLSRSSIYAIFMEDPSDAVADTSSTPVKRTPPKLPLSCRA